MTTDFEIGPDVDLSGKDLQAVWIKLKVESCGALQYVSQALPNKCFLSIFFWFVGIEIVWSRWMSDLIIGYLQLVG